jgi:hypothetical protein
MADGNATITVPTLVEGKWTYPESPAWSDADREAWEAVQGRKLHHDQARAAAEAKSVADASSPAALLAVARLEADEAQREREAAERRAAGAAAWTDALGKHGTKVTKIDDLTEGDVIVLRAWTARESDNADRRAEMVAAGILKQGGQGAEERAMVERTGVYLDETLKSVLHPARERMTYLLDRYSLLRGRIYAERDRLILGIRTDQGKGPALS